MSRLAFDREEILEYGLNGMVIPFGISILRIFSEQATFVELSEQGFSFFKNFPVAKPTRKEDCPMSAP